MTSPEGLLARLRERKLVQWGLAYLAGAWLVLQVLDFLRENFAWSPTIVRVSTVALAFGFVGALVLAWYHGEKGRQGVSGTEFTILVGLFLLGGIAVTFVPRAEPEPLGVLARGANPSVTVAVLPFENLSRSEDEALLAEGLTLEIGSRLTKVADLRVISRSAVSEALESGIEPSRLGAELGAGSLVEGTVQAAGGRIRITGSMSDAATYEQVWSESYDRELQDLFDLQSEVALAITQALEAELTPGEQARIEDPSTEDLAAFALFQRQTALFGNRPEQNRLGIELLKQAIELDPGFDDAHARLGWRYAWQVRLGRGETLDSARLWAERAVELNPESGYAHYSLGTAYIVEERRAAILEFRRALALEPSNPSVLKDLAAYLSWTGQLVEGLELAMRAVAIEPNDANTRFHAGVPLNFLADDDRTEAWLRHSLATVGDPTEPQTRNEVLLMWLDVFRGRLDDARGRARTLLGADEVIAETEMAVAEALLVLGDFAEARGILAADAPVTPEARSALTPSSRSLRTIHGLALWLGGDRGLADALFDESLHLNEEAIAGGSDLFWRFLENASIRALRGDHEDALADLQDVYAAGYLAPRFLRVDPMFESLRDDPRFIDLLERMDADLRRLRETAEREGITDSVDRLISESR